MAERRMIDLDPVRCVPVRTSIYFVLCRDYVKIGLSQRPKSRFYDIQVGNPYKCELIVIIELESKYEAEKYERMLHAEFDEFRVRGEWFKYNKEIKEYIRRLN